MSNELLIEPVSERTSRPHFTPLEKAVLLTIHYRDLFEHPLTMGELRKYLLLTRADDPELEGAIERLEFTHISRVGEYLTWRGREGIVPGRKVRLAASARLWDRARAYGRIVRRIPFVRMAGISGSLAVNHASEERDDIDLFCIAQPNRVWIVIFFLKFLYFYSRRVGGNCYVCANTCLAEDELEITAQNLYMAHQIVHVAPLWGHDIYAEFLRRNAWVGRFLPNAYVERLSSSTPAIDGGRLWGERLLPRRVGDGINRCLCRAGLRKAGRFYRATHTETMLHQARNLQRYMLPGLGYTGNVFRRFMDGHAARFANVLSREEMKAAFGCGEDVFVDPRLEQGFRWKYEHSG